MAAGGAFDADQPTGNGSGISLGNGHGELLPKTPTGISGLDDVTGGGLPQGRSTLVFGSAGRVLVGLRASPELLR